MREGHASDINSGAIRREIVKACLGCLKFESCIHRKNASSRMMMPANPKFGRKTAMMIASV
jgi:hypothetical protein